MSASPLTVIIESRDGKQNNFNAFLMILCVKVSHKHCFFLQNVEVQRPRLSKNVSYKTKTNREVILFCPEVNSKERSARGVEC